MAVQPGRNSAWRTLLLHGLDTASDLSELVVQKISAATDPRERQLRRRRRALRWGLIFSAGCVFWGVVTAILAAWGWFALLLEITGGVAVVQAMIATLLLIRYRWLKADPLPAQRPTNIRRLPPPSSAARPAMYALGASERGFFSLLGAMERAANGTPQSRAYLAPTINAFTAQLSAGVRQYNEMVTAAAQLVSSANGDRSAPLAGSRQRYRDELAGATDRLVGWSRAFDELGGLPRRAETLDFLAVV